MKKFIYFLLVLALLGTIVYIISVKKTHAPVGEFSNPYLDLIKITVPLPSALVASPLTVKGEARGSWYFEASFPVKLFDANGRELAVAPAQAQGEWMTENFVPFEVKLNFTKPQTKCGTLVLAKDNPSGLPEHDAEVHLPVCF